MKKGVLFVCIGNACRSTMAEALTRHYWGDAIEAFSVGTFPLGHISPFTLEALREQAIPVTGLDSKGFADIPFERIQFVVVLTRASCAHLLPSAFSGKVIHWHVQDPFGLGIDAYREVRYIIELMVRRKLPEWLELDKVRPDHQASQGDPER